MSATLLKERTEPHSILVPPFCAGTSRPRSMVRPSLLDLRFTGDPWLVDDEAGIASVCLDDYRLAQVCLLSLDVPAFNRLFLGMRQSRSRYPVSRHPSRLLPV